MGKKPIVDISYGYNVLEESLGIRRDKKSGFIGIPKETHYQEKRIPLTPETVAVLVNNGHRVVIEKDAGKAAMYSDVDFSNAGAQVFASREEVFKSDTILKTAPIDDDEIRFLKPNQVIISPLHLPSMSRDILTKCLEKQIIGISLADIKDEDDNLPIVQSMSQIAGVYSIQMASNLLNRNNYGIGILLGGVTGVPATHAVIIGAGMVALHAAKAALGLGAQVTVFDSSVNRLMRLQKDIPGNINTSIFSGVIVQEVLRTTDVLISAVKPQKGVIPLMITEDMIRNMKPGSVVIDVNIDKGGSIETSEMTSHENPTFIKHDVIHYCVPNMASGVPRTASQMISNVLMPLLLDAFNNEGGFEQMIRNKRSIVHAVYAFQGKLTHKSLADRFDMKYTHLDLILPLDL